MHFVLNTRKDRGMVSSNKHVRCLNGILLCLHYYSIHRCLSFPGDTICGVHRYISKRRILLRCQYIILGKLITWFNTCLNLQSIAVHLLTIKVSTICFLIQIERSVRSHMMLPSYLVSSAIYFNGNAFGYTSRFQTCVTELINVHRWHIL